ARNRIGPLRGHACPLWSRGGRANRAQARGLVFERPSGLGGISGGGKSDNRHCSRQRSNPILLRAIPGSPAGMNIVPPIRRRRGFSAPRYKQDSRPNAPPEAAVILAALADPVVVVDRNGIIRFVNPAAEQFFGSGAAALCGGALVDLVAPHSPLLSLVASVWRIGSTISEHDMLLEGPRFGRRSVTIQGSPTGEGADVLVLTLHERSIADMMDRHLNHRNAARSITAMAAMLAHEVKNPLSGIRGAAQLLEQDADSAGRELTQLICDETDRIVALVDRMEAF